STNRSKGLFASGSTLAVPVDGSGRLVGYPGSVRKSLDGLDRDRCGVGRTLHGRSAESHFRSDKIEERIRRKGSGSSILRSHRIKGAMPPIRMLFILGSNDACASKHH